LLDPYLTVLRGIEDECEICPRPARCATSPQRVGGPFSKRELSVSRLHDSTFDLCAGQVNLVAHNEDYPKAEQQFKRIKSI
jgi:hypothetical protein